MTDQSGFQPTSVKLANGATAQLRFMTPADVTLLRRFAAALPPDDLLFLRMDITRRPVVVEWGRAIRRGDTVSLLAFVDDRLAAFASLHRERTRWTRGIGEIRVNVAPAYRTLHLGRALTWEMFDTARSLGVRKVTAQMIAEQESARNVFRQFGFEEEAVLKDWVEDRAGNPRDLVVMSYDLRWEFAADSQSPTSSTGDAR